MSRFVDGYKDFTQARTREAGRNYSFMEYIEEHRRPPDFLLTDEGTLVPLNGFIGLLAAGRVIADIDSVGGDGGNAGFVWLRDENGVITAAQTVKIDPGFAFHFNKPGNWAFNTRQNNKGRKLDDIRDIQIATNHHGVTILWGSLTPKQKDAFLSALQNCARYLSEEVLSFLFYREGRFEHMPRDIAGDMASNFKIWVALQLEIYGEEISQFKREHPLYQLRIEYMDEWGELPILLSQENVLTSRFFTPLVIKRQQTLHEEQGNHLQQISLKNHGESVPVTNQSIGPDQLFVEARHVLLVGPPGIGKSAFSQKIAPKQLSGHSLNDRFDALYWLPLRRLNLAVEAEGFLHGVTDPDLFLARAVATILVEDQSLTDALLGEIRNNKPEPLSFSGWVRRSYTCFVQSPLPLLQETRFADPSHITGRL